MKHTHFSLLIFASALLASCSMLSLADDITPPPGSQQEVFVETNPPPTSSGPLYPLVAPNPQNGAAIFTDKCAPCHGVTGQGDGPQASQLPNPTTAIGSSEVARLSTPAGWYSIVTRGNLDRFMPPFPSLSDRQRWDVIAYVYSLSAHSAVIAQGQELYLENCAACHGESGKGNGPQAAALSSSLPDFTDQAFMAKKSGNDFYQILSNGQHPEMPAFSNVLSNDELWLLADYLRHFSFIPQGQMASAPDPNSPFPTSEPEEITQSPVTAPGFGVITGQVINGSGGEPLENLAVTLHGFDGMQVAVTNTVTTQPGGVFTFDDVPMPANRIYLATAEFGNATYASSFLTVQESTESLSMNITVYETTTDLSHLLADRMHIFLDFSEPSTVQVIELYIMSNVGKKTIVSSEKGGPVVVFPLPEGATNLQFQDGELGSRYIEVPGGFADTMTLPPTTGEYQVLFGYELPYNRKLEFRRSFNMDVDSVVILQPDSGVKVRSDQLQDSGPRDVQGVSYQMYMGGPFESGSTLVLNISGRSGAGPTLAASSSQSLVLGMGVFGVVMIVAGFWLYRRNQTNGHEEVHDIEEDEEETHVVQDRESLIDAIVALDDLYQEGELPEDAYRKRRAELKEHLREISE